MHVDDPNDFNEEPPSTKKKSSVTTMELEDDPKDPNEKPPSNEKVSTDVSKAVAMESNPDNGE